MDGAPRVEVEVQVEARRPSGLPEAAESAPPAHPLDAPLVIGSLRLATNLTLAPLAGFTDLAFRLACRAQGGVGLATTELVSATALNRDARSTPRYLATAPGDEPLAVQIDAGEVSELVEAAKKVEDRGYAAVDINMGCPVFKITRKGGGSCWTRTPSEAAAAVGEVARAVRIPVTVKTRLGWDDDQITAPSLAEALEQVGCAALTIHGRTREQGFSGRASLAGIRAVASAVRRLPIIGNGDVTSPAAARDMMIATGCAGVAIGRAALADPWIFPATAAYLATGRLPPPPDLEARLALVRHHFEGLLALFGERHAVVRFRKAGVRYAGPLGVGKDYRREMSFAADARAVEAILDGVAAGAYGRLPPRPADACVRVPKGPVEKW
jgi:nifR3 family TIM-barrel protein